MENDEKSKHVNQKVLKNDDFKLQTDGCYGNGRTLTKNLIERKGANLSLSIWYVCLDQFYKDNNPCHKIRLQRLKYKASVTVFGIIPLVPCQFHILFRP